MVGPRLVGWLVVGLSTKGGGDVMFFGILLGGSVGKRVCIAIGSSGFWRFNAKLVAGGLVNPFLIIILLNWMISRK